MRRSYLYIFFCVAVLFSGCTFKTAGTWKNDGIPQKIKNVIAPLDQQILEGLQTDNTTLVSELFSEELKKMLGTQADSILHEMHAYIGSAGFDVLEQFYVKTPNIGSEMTLISDAEGADQFYFTYTTRTYESFVSLLVPKSTAYDFLFTIVYGKTKEGWRINILKCGLLRIDGKTAPQLFARAKKEDEKGYLADAVNTMYLAGRTLTPGGDYFSYTNREEITEFGDQVIEKAKNTFTFPTTVRQLKTQPQILAFSPQATDEGYYPLIEYYTTVSMHDSAGLHIENNQLHNIIGEIFPGIDKDKKYVFYKAHEIIPDGVTEHNVYKFVQETEYSNQ